MSTEAEVFTVKRITHLPERCLPIMANIFPDVYSRLEMSRQLSANQQADLETTAKELLYTACYAINQLREIAYLVEAGILSRNGVRAYPGLTTVVDVLLNRASVPDDMFIHWSTFRKATEPIMI